MGRIVEKRDEKRAGWEDRTEKKKGDQERYRCFWV